MVTVVAGLRGGIALGRRFKVFILLPAVTAAVFFFAIGAVVADDSAWPTLWTVIEVVPAIQSGYLICIAGADVVARALGGRHAYFSALAPISNPAE
jgi:hypothetical protein